MAIYSLNHKCIGKSTQDKAFTAVAHIRYITRDSACRIVLGDKMPTDPKEAQKWFKSEEKSSRKNARVCDKVMIALPLELNAKQRVELVKDFAGRVTSSRVPWIAAIHDKNKDKSNPHCHLVFRDRDMSTGKRALHMSAGKSERQLLKERGIDAMTTDRLRVIWEHTTNEALARAGHKVKIDHRTLERQGIRREPTIHEGVQARQIGARGVKPVSKMVKYPNMPTARSKDRFVDYTSIDAGLTRFEENKQRKKRNRVRDFFSSKADREINHGREI